MRDILFRGISEVTDEWVYGYFVKTRIGGNEYFSIVPYDDLAKTLAEKRWFQVIPETVGQYTGLTDKNGKKIFEGDIWKRGDICGIVRWDFDEARFIVSYEIDGIEYQNAVLERNLKSIEIIGNIHDNPELLKGGVDNGIQH